MFHSKRRNWAKEEKNVRSRRADPSESKRKPLGSWIREMLWRWLGSGSGGEQVRVGEEGRVLQGGESEGMDSYQGKRVMGTQTVQATVLVTQWSPALVPPWTAGQQAPLSLGFSRQEYDEGSHFLLQGIFPMQELNPRLPHCRQILYCLRHQGSLHTEIQVN